MVQGVFRPALAAALLFVASLAADGSARAQENPLLDFWLNPLGGGAPAQQSAPAAPPVAQGRPGRPGRNVSGWSNPARVGSNKAANTGQGWAGQANAGQGGPVQPIPVYRAPGQNVHDALWDDPFDPGGSGNTSVDDVFANSPQPIDMANTVPILSDQTSDSLKAAISRYQSIVENGGWQSIGNGEAMQVGFRGPQVASLRARLIATGDLRQQAGQADAFDSFVYQAVVTFQRRHGLRPNGRVDERTRSALNVPARARLSQLGINLDRIAKLRNGLSKRHVLVNIPGAEIEAVNNGVVESRHRAVVGRLERPTPIIKSQIMELNFYPYWHVPESIVRRDLVPTIREDFDYLERTKLRVYSDWGYKNEVDPTTVDWNSDDAFKLHFRQEPGDGNALGYVKINFPNQHQVYMHDTPKRRLFGEELRAYSSGCVRIQNVDDLVTWLLGTQDEWSGERVQSVIQAGQSQNVGLKNKVQLHMTYITAWATGDGTVHFRRDLYGRDGVGELAANY